MIENISLLDEDNERRLIQRARRRKLIRVLHFDFIKGSEDMDIPQMYGFSFRSNPNPFRVATNPMEPGLSNLRVYSERQRIGYRTPESSNVDLFIERAQPFSVFSLDICPASYNNMTVHIIGNCVAGAPPDAMPDCHDHLKVVVLDADSPRTVHLDNCSNIRSLLIRESPKKKDRDAKILHQGAVEGAPSLIGIVNIKIKLQREKYLAFPDPDGSFPS